MQCRQVYLFILTVSLSIPLAAGRSGGAAAGSTRGSNSHTPVSAGAKSVYVHGYYRNDGTYVSGYVRSAAGEAPHAAAGEAAPIRVTDPGSPVPAHATSRAKAPAGPAVGKSRLAVYVLGDPATKHYFRETCTAPATATRMLRSDAIAAGYRPDSGCFASPSH